MTRFLIIGAGKLAKHLQNYFSLLGLPTPVTWDRAQNPQDLKARISESTHILLAISDSSIADFYQKHLIDRNKTVVHFSGALTVDGIIAAHPLMSFSSSLYPLETYQHIHFVITGCEKLTDALPGLPNSFSILSPEKKPLYHALCVMGGNFPVILWQKMFSELTALGIPPKAAEIYLQTILANTLQNPSSALTGPLARKDATTVSKNIEALKGDAFQNVYHAFVQAIAPELLTSGPAISTGPLPPKERPT